MSILKTAVIFSSNRKVADVKIYQETTTDIITIIPTANERFIFFYPKENLTIQIMEDEKIHNYQVCFKEIKLIQNLPYYVFQIVESEVFENNRKETRQFVEYEAVYSNFEKIGYATILDLSKTGAKIETNFPVKGNVLELHFNEGSSTKVCAGTIVWAKQEGDKYFYGLKFQRVEVL